MYDFLHVWFYFFAEYFWEDILSIEIDICEI